MGRRGGELADTLERGLSASLLQEEERGSSAEEGSDDDGACMTSPPACSGVPPPLPPACLACRHLCSEQHGWVSSTLSPLLYDRLCAEDEDDDDDEEEGSEEEDGSPSARRRPASTQKKQRQHKKFVVPPPREMPQRTTRGARMGSAMAEEGDEEFWVRGTAPATPSTSLWRSQQSAAQCLPGFSAL